MKVNLHAQFRRSQLVCCPQFSRIFCLPFHACATTGTMRQNSNFCIRFQMQKQPLILLLFVFCCAYHFQPTKAVNCSTITDCRTCTSASDFLVPCQWCLLGRHCESGWAIQSSTKCPHNERILNAYNCPISPSPKQPFLDEFARSRVLPFIAALNADNQQQVTTIQSKWRHQIPFPDSNLPGEQRSHCHGHSPLCCPM